jgi:hypothetical protein
MKKEITHLNKKINYVRINKNIERSFMDTMSKL